MVLYTRSHLLPIFAAIACKLFETFQGGNLFITSLSSVQCRAIDFVVSLICFYSY